MSPKAKANTKFSILWKHTRKDKRKEEKEGFYSTKIL
jgi:hypothetical protein